MGLEGVGVAGEVLVAVVSAVVMAVAALESCRALRVGLRRLGVVGGGVGAILC